MKPYSVFNHGKSSRVYNKVTRQYGIVTDFKETFNEYIQPLVLYDSEVVSVIVEPACLMLVEDGDETK